MENEIVKRLRVPSDTEEVMKSWDTLRAYLLEGRKGSYARDIFESILSHIDEEREEAADRIEALEAEVARYQQLLDAAIDDYNNARNSTLEEAARLIELDVIDSSVRLDPSKHKNLSDWFRDQQAAAIRALKSDPAPVPDPKPFTFSDPVRQAEWERHKAESKRREVE